MKDWWTLEGRFCVIFNIAFSCRRKGPECFWYKQPAAGRVGSKIDSQGDVGGAGADGEVTSVEKRLNISEHELNLAQPSVEEVEWTITAVAFLLNDRKIQTNK